MNFRKIFFWIHLSAGIVIGAVIFSMAASGVIIAFEPQITAFAEKKVRTIEPAGAARLSLKELTARAAAQNPGAKPTGVMLQADPASSVAVMFGKEAVFYVNPYTGEVLGPGSKIHDLLHKVEDFHRSLLAGEAGSKITGAACFIFFGMILSGLYLWWPRNWKWPGIKAVVFYNFRLRGKARDWNLHNVTGLWFAPLLIISALTGLIMAYPWANNLLFRLAGSEPPAQNQKMGGGTKKNLGQNVLVAAADFDALFASIQTRVPNWESMSIRVPRDAQAPATAYIQEKGSPAFIRSQMTLNASTAEIIKWEPVAEQNFSRRLRAWVRPVHIGQAGGIAGQFLAFCSAFGAMTLVWTGFAMAWRRFFSKKILASTRKI